MLSLRTRLQLFVKAARGASHLALLPCISTSPTGSPVLPFQKKAGSALTQGLQVHLPVTITQRPQMPITQQTLEHLSVLREKTNLEELPYLLPSHKIVLTWGHNQLSKPAVREDQWSGVKWNQARKTWYKIVSQFGTVFKIKWCTHSFFLSCIYLTNTYRNLHARSQRDKWKWNSFSSSGILSVRLFFTHWNAYELPEIMV